MTVTVVIPQMFSKIFRGRAARSCALQKQAVPPIATALDPDRPPSPLRIIHAGGYAERYYMAIPAVLIIEKYPRAVLARPDVFRRPWEAVVRPEEILTPGEKFYIVPRSTVLKLQKRARRLRASQPQPKMVNSSRRKSKTDDGGGASDKVIRKENVTRSSRRVRYAGMWQPSLVVIDEGSTLMAPPPPSPMEGFI